MGIEEQVPFFTLMTTYIAYIIILAFGHARDWVGARIFRLKRYDWLRAADGYAPLTSDFESFYTRRLYKRIRDCWNRPTTGLPSRTVQVLERYSPDYNESFHMTGNTSELINLSSYNYLGFSANAGSCTDDVERCLESEGIGIFAANRCEAGTLACHDQLETIVATFLGKEAALISNMGFATNSLVIHSLLGKGCLLLSDELNHSSIVCGSRLSGATIRTFPHLNVRAFETVLREAIIQGQPKSRRPWKKIGVFLEGLYSMEGDMPDLKAFVALRDKYKFFIFLDEAHSIGALGPTGRGASEACGIEPAQIDILMGTFTKSFGAAGGYIAGSKELIGKLKRTSISYLFSEPMAPFVCQQIISAFRLLQTAKGLQKIEAVRKNSDYFAEKLKALGYLVLGCPGSPVIPALIVHPCKLRMFSHECMKRGLAVVVVGYPATPIITSRARFCLSAAHTKKDLEYALAKLDEVGDLLGLKMRSQ